MYSQGSYEKSQKVNNQWANYLEENFQEKEYVEQQQTFQEKNTRLNKALKHKFEKGSKPTYQKEVPLPKISEIQESNINMQYVKPALNKNPPPPPGLAKNPKANGLN